jgi:endonuclease YncB( thermonuclease family)
VWGPIWVFLALVIAIPVGDGINAVVKQYPECRVLSVVDGDTVKLSCPQGGVQSARLLGYDTPEVKGACPSETWAATKATFYLRWQLWTAKQIDARVQGMDRYQRALTRVLLDSEDVAERMVNAGLARRYSGGKREGWCS